MPTIYIDMDGVVADFDTRAREIIKKEKTHPQQERWDNASWSKLKSHPNFYRNLPKMPQADAMIDLARRFRDELNWKLYILTAIPRNNDMPDVFHDKILWIHDYYPDIRVRFGPYSDDKHVHCDQGDILVDDRTSNCEEWTRAKGIAVKVSKDYNQALQTLTDLFEKIKFTQMVVD